MNIWRGEPRGEGGRNEEERERERMNFGRVCAHVHTRSRLEVSDRDYTPPRFYCGIGPLSSPLISLHARLLRESSRATEDEKRKPSNEFVRICEILEWIVSHPRYFSPLVFYFACTGAQVSGNCSGKCWESMEGEALVDVEMAEWYNKFFL